MYKMLDKMCFVGVEFPDDPNVVGNVYWYLCPSGGAEVGDCAVAPLGRHNRLQNGVVRKVLYALPKNAPFPLNLIKNVVEIVKPLQ